MDGSGNPTTYSVTAGGAPAVPNYDAPNSGSWSFQANETSIRFGSGNTVNVLVATSTALRLEWTVPEVIEKTMPTYRFNLER